MSLCQPHIQGSQAQRACALGPQAYGVPEPLAEGPAECDRDVPAGKGGRQAFRRRGQEQAVTAVTAVGSLTD